MRAVLPLIITVSLLWGCDQVHEIEPTAEQISSLSEPVADAQSDVELGDVKLMAQNGYAPTAPGINADYGELANYYKMEMLPGSEDDGRFQRLNELVFIYAKSYNAEVMRLIGCDADAPIACKNASGVEGVSGSAEY